MERTAQTLVRSALGGPIRRRIVVVLAFCPFPLLLATDALRLGIGIALWMLFTWVLATLTGWLGYARAPKLDEREQQERGVSFRPAYAILVLIAALSSTFAEQLGSRSGQTLVLFGILLPSAVAAWRMRDAGPDGPLS